MPRFIVEWDAGLFNVFDADDWNDALIRVAFNVYNSVGDCADLVYDLAEGHSKYIRVYGYDGDIRLPKPNKKFEMRLIAELRKRKVEGFGLGSDLSGDEEF